MYAASLLFLAGVLGCLYLPELPPPHLYLLAPVSLCLFTGSRMLRGMAFFISGFLWCLLRADMMLDNGLDRALEGQTVQITGRICDLPVYRDGHSRLLLAIEQMEIGGKRVIRPPRKVRLGWYHTPHKVRAGERWQLLVRLKRPWGFMNPGGFDYEGWLFQQRIQATGWVRQSAGNRRLSAAAVTDLQSVREKIRDRLRQAVGEKHYFPFILALILGDRSSIASADRDVLVRTGTAHLLAISGLHIGLVATLVFFLLRWCWSLLLLPLVGVPSQYVAALGALAAAILYAAMAGFTLPTQRAFIMLAVVLAMLLMNRTFRSGDIPGTALLLVLVYDPLAPISPGFWLSFIAVFIILFCCGYRANMAPRLWRWLRLQYAISIGLVPLLVLIFNQVPLNSIISNSIAIPWVSLVTVPLLLTGTVLTIPGLSAGPLLLLMGNISLELLWPVLRAIAAIPLSHVAVADLPVAADVMLVAALTVLLLPTGVIWRSTALLLLLPLAFVRPPAIQRGEILLTVLDVGQGLAVVVQTENHTLLYDTGPAFSADFNAGSAVVLPFFRAMAVPEVDILVLSHGDTDHSGGLSTLLAGVPVHHMMAPQQDLAALVPVQVCRRGGRWQWDGVRFTFLSPTTAGRTDGNNSSCVLHIESVSGTILLPGDIEHVVESRLLRRYGQSLASDILLAPHHGSRTSSSRGFVRAVDPGYVVYASGYRNRFGFPKVEVTRRYRAQGSVQMLSHRSGAITFHLRPGTILVKQHRQIRQRIWHTMP